MQILEELQSLKMVLGTRVNTNWKQINLQLGLDAIKITGTSNFSQAVYHLLNNLAAQPRCYCDKPLVFLGKKYRKFCSKQCSGRANSTLQNRINTNFAKFGVDFPAQSQIITDKMRCTVQEKYGDSPAHLFGGSGFKSAMVKKYGVTNAAKKREFFSVHTATAQNKFTSRMEEHLENHGFHSLQKKLHSLHALKFRHVCGHELSVRVWADKIPRCKICQPHTASAQHLVMREFLTSKEIRFSENDRTVIAPLELDFYIPENKLAIELNGVYWHSDQQGTPKDYHQRKTLLCQELGITLIHIFEDALSVSSAAVFNRLWENYLNIDEANLCLESGTVLEVDGCWPLPQNSKIELVGFSQPNLYVVDEAFKPKVKGKIWDSGVLYYCSRLNT